MITKTIKTTNGPLKITIPSDIKEITLGMLEALTPEPGSSYNELEQISILSGVPIGNPEFDKKEIDLDLPTLADICDIEALTVFQPALQTIAYQLAGFEAVQQIPDIITLELPGMGVKKWFNFNTGNPLKIIKVTKNLGIAPAGAYLEAKEVIKKELDLWDKAKQHFAGLNPTLTPDQVNQAIEFKPSVSAYLRLLSLYFYCPATGEKFKPGKIKEFDSIVKQLPVTQALPIARYFFLKYPNLSKPKITPSMSLLNQLRSKQV